MGLVLYNIINNKKGGFIDITTLLVLKGDSKYNTAFLLKIVFFLGRAVAKYIIYFNIFLSIY